MGLIYRCLATGQTSSLSKLMMQHEVTWLIRRQSKIARVKLGHTLDFQFAHCKGWCDIFRPEHLTCKSKCQVTTHGIEDVQFNWIGRKTQSVRKTWFRRRIGENTWMWTELARSLFCKWENRNIYETLYINARKEYMYDGVIYYMKGGGGCYANGCISREKSLFRVVLYFPTCWMKPSEKISLDSIWLLNFKFDTRWWVTMRSQMSDENRAL